MIIRCEICQAVSTAEKNLSLAKISFERKSLEAQQEYEEKQRLVGLKPQTVSFECETRNNFASADIKRMIQHPHYYSERGEEAAAKNMATRDALELRCPFCVPTFSSLPPQVDTSDGFGIFCSDERLKIV